MSDDIGMRIYFENGEYEVWIGPADDLKSDNIINAFIAGLSETRDQAVAKAVRELEALVEQLQAPTVCTNELLKRAVDQMRADPRHFQFELEQRTREFPEEAR